MAVSVEAFARAGRWRQDSLGVIVGGGICRHGALPDEYVFVAPSGGPLRYANFRSRVLGPACKRLGFTNTTFHDLRRFNATVMVGAGVDLKTAQVRLGHADPRLTLALYAQATTAGDLTAAGALDKAFEQQNRVIEVQGSAMNLGLGDLAGVHGRQLGIPHRANTGTSLN